MRLRAYGQKDPLVEYKNEGAKMFKQLEGHINAYIANLIFKIGPAPSYATAPESGPAVKVSPPAGGSGKKSEIGRNAPCPCGSGKKYKKCHGK